MSDSSMRRLRFSLVVCIFLGLTATAPEAFGQRGATLLLLNGKFWTVNPKQPEAEAVAIAGNRILAVGTTEEIERWRQPGVSSVDLGGRRVLPGFNDAHVHFFAGGT